MRQIMYVSKSTAPADRLTLNAILQHSRHNNALDGITGLLWSDGERFAQIIEGDAQAIGETMERIRADSRHHDIVVLRDGPISERQFGDWSMQLRGNDEQADSYDKRMRRALDDASEAIRSVFASLIAPIAA